MTDLQWHGTAVNLAVARAALNAVEEAGDELLRSANETVPFDTGMLAQSGQVDVNAAALTATVSYSTPYAIRQHEDINLRHPNPRSTSSSPKGRARWLELTGSEEASRLHTWVAARMKGLL